MLGLAGAAIVVLGFVQPIAHNSPTLRSAAETLFSLLALLAAWLVGVQFHHTRRMRKLLLVSGLVALAAVEFLANALPAALHLHSALALGALQPVGKLVAAAAFAAAALTPPRRVLTGGRHPLALSVGLSVAALGVAEIIGLRLGSRVLAGTWYSGHAIDRAMHQPVEWVVWLGTVGLFLCAAWGFAREGLWEADRSRVVLAGAMILLAAARVYELALPSITPELVTPREVLRLFASVLLLGAIVQTDLEIREQRTRAAALAERRRIAADLHDVLAQDLALIAAHEGRIAKDWGQDHPVTVAVKHALAISREQISALSDVSSSPPEDALRAVAHELRTRFGIDVVVDVDPEMNLAPDVQEHIVRIAREAINNAARHGGAKNVVVCLNRSELAHVLRVCDDGHGIDDAGHMGRPLGFGMRNMQERVSALGGQMRIRPRKGGGTDLTLIFV